MSKKPLHDHLKDFYNQQHLSESKLQTLLEAKPRQNMLAPLSTIAAAFLLFVVTGWLYIGTYSDVALRVAEEIALNHHKQLDLEFKTSSLADLNKQMKKLEFKIIESDLLQRNIRDGQKFELLGARYCSIQGNLAAQIRYRNQKQRLITVYQTSMTKRLKKGINKKFKLKGIHIDQWQEQGVFVGLAR